MDANGTAAMPPRKNAKAIAALALGATGVVYGDIGTSPLYAFREAVGQAAGGGISEAEILGVLSLMVWALIIVVTIKYVLFLMRADNDGEGGVLALMALAQRGIAKRSTAVILLGATGAALFYGDAILTPALSVLSAVEGLKTVPGLADSVTEGRILLIATVILVTLFAVQSRGTASVARLFGPICAVWFLSIAALGCLHIADAPQVFAAFSPTYATGFLANHGIVGLFVLGAVFLTVTGAEALTADMGHFGRLPIQVAWLGLVFPALLLCYFGQGAMALEALRAAQAAGQQLENRDWFFLLAPESFRIPLVILATMATIIASQAVITGAYSLTQQAMQLGLLPRMRITNTSRETAGQIYLPAINWLLLLGVLVLVFGFRNSSDMAAAYGIAVTGTMIMTTCLAFIVVRRKWQWSLPLALTVIAPLLAIDMIFFGANILRVADGGWVPLLVGAVIGFLIYTWRKGRRVLGDRLATGSIATADLAASLAARPPHSVEGTAVFLTSTPGIAPSALLHNLKHNRVLHARNLLVSVKTRNTPYVADADRVAVETVDDRFSLVTLSYGFSETPDVPRDLKLCGVPLEPMTTSYFISRQAIRPTHGQAMPFWQDLVFIFLHRNASDPTDFFCIPHNRVVELGSQVEI
jgi:KUP system potassium uptake protein